MSSTITPAAAAASAPAITDPLASQKPSAGLGLIAGTTTGALTATTAGTLTVTGTMPGGTAAGSSDDLPLELQAQLFRALLADPMPAREWASWSALQTTVATIVPDSYNPATDDSTLPRGSTLHPTDPGIVYNNVDVASLLVSASQPSSDVPAAAAAAADPEPTFAELIERHVRRTLATRATGRQESDEVRLELTDAVLPDTSLSLRRSSAGWQLTAVTGDRGSLERLEQFTPALVKRFANASLGSLEVVSRLETHGLITAGAGEASC